MKKITKRALLTISICITWLLVIFFFSAMNANSSSNLTDVVLEILEKIRSHNSLIDGIFTKLTENHSLFFIVRKMAHMFVFCVLQIIVFNLFRALKMPFAKAAVFSILAVFGYACLDEFHQLFVDGRSGQFTDVMIDTFGGIIGLNIVILSKLFISFVKKIKQKYLSVDCCINK